jgi:hypothetical protein
LDYPNNQLSQGFGQSTKSGSNCQLLISTLKNIDEDDLGHKVSEQMDKHAIARCSRASFQAYLEKPKNPPR